MAAPGSSPADTIAPTWTGRSSTAPSISVRFTGCGAPSCDESWCTESWCPGPWDDSRSAGPWVDPASVRRGQGDSTGSGPGVADLDSPDEVDEVAGGSVSASGRSDGMTEG